MKKGKYVPKIDLEVTYDHIKAAYEILTNMPEIQAEQLFEAKKIVEFSAEWIEKFEVDKNDLSKVTQSTPPDRLDQTGGECVGNGYRIRKVNFFF